MNDLISRQEAIDALEKESQVDGAYGYLDIKSIIDTLKDLPSSAQPVRNITMSEVLRYIDDMPEDAWQEFTACLECRGWNFERKTAKWCGGEFA